MKWTKNQPTEQGFYWYRRDWRLDWEVTVVSVTFEDGEDYVHFIGGSTVLLDEVDGWWYGPLQPPEV